MKERWPGAIFLSRKALEAHVFGGRQRLRLLDQRLQRKAGPGDRHRPGLDAAMAIEPLLEADRLDEHRRCRSSAPSPPGRRASPSRAAIFSALGVEMLVGAEFVEIIVVEIDLFRRHLAVELVGVVALGGIERGAGVGVLGESRARERGRAGDRAGAGQEAAAVEKDRLRAWFRWRAIPSRACDDSSWSSLARDASTRTSAYAALAPEVSEREAAIVTRRALKLSRPDRIRGRPASRGRRSTPRL